MILETERLVLRRYTIDDLDGLVAVLCDRLTMRFYPRSFSRDDAAVWIDNNLARYENDSHGLWAMDLKATGQFVGNCGPVKQIVEGRSEVELGWHVNRKYWGQGLATEAGAACRDYAFTNLGVARLVSLILPENVQSRRVAEKIGMHVEKQVEFKGLNHCLYVMTAQSSA